MLKINKAREPRELADFKQEYQDSIGWKEVENIKPGFKNRLKEYILEHEQKVNQGFCCVYCEKAITSKGESSHIEHIKPRAKFKEETFNYGNLIVSCQEEITEVNSIKQRKSTCGHHKEDKFDENKFVNPVLSNPEDFFTYSVSDGEIIPLSDMVREKAEYTIKLLNLNHPHLKHTRTAIIDELFSYNDRNKLMDVIDNYHQFPGICRFFKSECLMVWEQKVKDRQNR